MSELTIYLLFLSLLLCLPFLTPSSTLILLLFSFTTCVSSHFFSLPFLVSAINRIFSYYMLYLPNLSTPSTSLQGISMKTATIAGYKCYFSCCCFRVFVTFAACWQLHVDFSAFAAKLCCLLRSWPGLSPFLLHACEHACYWLLPRTKSAHNTMKENRKGSGWLRDTL